MPSEFTWEVRVYYEDTDAGGIVYYANYLKFLNARAPNGCARSALVSRNCCTSKTQCSSSRT